MSEFEQQVAELKKRLRENPENTLEILANWIVVVQNEKLLELIESVDFLKRKFARAPKEEAETKAESLTKKIKKMIKKKS